MKTLEILFTQCSFHKMNNSIIVHISENECLFLILSLPVPRWASANTHLPSNKNISKTVRVNIAFTIIF